MNEGKFLQLLVNELERAGIPFMITGSLASGYHGEPPMSYDMDLVIDASVTQIDNLVAASADRCYVSAEAARQAVRARTMFNVIDLTSGIKADLIIRKERAFSETEFARRKPARVLGVSAIVVTAEDSILSKLEWHRLTVR